MNQEELLLGWQEAIARANAAWYALSQCLPLGDDADPRTDPQHDEVSGDEHEQPL